MLLDLDPFCANTKGIIGQRRTIKINPLSYCEGVCREVNRKDQKVLVWLPFPHFGLRGADNMKESRLGVSNPVIPLRISEHVLPDCTLSCPLPAGVICSSWLLASSLYLPVQSVTRLPA